MAVSSPPSVSAACATRYAAISRTRNTAPAATNAVRFWLDRTCPLRGGCHRFRRCLSIGWRQRIRGQHIAKHRFDRILHSRCRSEKDAHDGHPPRRSRARSRRTLLAPRHNIIPFEEEVVYVAIAMLVLMAWFLVVGRLGRSSGLLSGRTTLMSLVGASYFGYPIWAFWMGRQLASRASLHAVSGDLSGRAPRA